MMLLLEHRVVIACEKESFMLSLRSLYRNPIEERDQSEDVMERSKEEEREECKVNKAVWLQKVSSMVLETTSGRSDLFTLI